jgi:phage protein D
MATANARATLYPARPTLRIDGQLKQSLGESDLQSLLVEETTLGLFRCEANFLNWGPRQGQVGFVYFDRQTLDFGKVFSVEFGPPGADNPVFAGRITGIEAHYPLDRPPEIQILAEDRLQDLRMERRTRSFENVTDADVIRRIATQHGLTAQVDIDGPTYRTLVQFNQSDLAFLRERVAAVDAELWIDNRTLYAQARSRRSAGTVSCAYGKELLEFSVLADLAHQRTAVKVSGWNANAKDSITAEAGESAISAELQGGRGGGAVLGQALAPRRDRVVLAMPLSQPEARQLAEARYRTQSRRFIRGSGIVDGNARLRVGATVALQGLGAFFDGPYYVTLARHAFTLQDGYRTAFEAERAGIGG